MPIPVTKYRCAFKCGTLAMHTAKKAQEHEDKFCYKNPKNKTCATCKNMIYTSDSDGFTRWHMRGCKLEEMNDFIESIHDKLEIKQGVGHIKPLWNCLNHNMDYIQFGTENYIEDIKCNYTKKESELANNFLVTDDLLSF